jgi:hypothetical protein
MRRPLQQAILATPRRDVRRLASGLLLLLGWCAGAPAALLWERTEQIVPLPGPAATEVTGTFPFRNAGAVPVRVLAVRLGCPCGQAATDRSEYAPGESGTLTVRLQAQRGAGRIEKTIYVLTDDPEQPRDTILFGCEAPAYLAVEPGWLVWRQGDPPEARTARLRADVPEPVHVLAVRTEPAGFQHEFLTVTAGRAYDLRITPENTSTRRRQGFTLLVQHADATPFELNVAAVVLPALKAPPAPGWTAVAWALLASDRAWTLLTVLILTGLALLGWRLLRGPGRRLPPPPG